MSGRVEDFELERSPAQHVAFLQELVDFDSARRRDTQPGGLHRQVAIQRQIALVHQDPRAGSLLEFLDAAHVVDVGVRGDDVFCAQVAAGEDFFDAVDIVAGVDHHGFPGGLVAHNRAVAPEHSDRDDFVDHSILGLCDPRIRDNPSPPAPLPQGERGVVPKNRWISLRLGVFA